MHGIHGKECLVALHIGEIIQRIRIPSIKREPEQQLACQGQDIGTVLDTAPSCSFREIFFRSGTATTSFVFETENMAQCKDTSVNHGYQEISF